MSYRCTVCRESRLQQGWICDYFWRRSFCLLFYFVFVFFGDWFCHASQEAEEAESCENGTLTLPSAIIRRRSRRYLGSKWLDISWGIWGAFFEGIAPVDGLWLVMDVLRDIGQYFIPITIVLFRHGRRVHRSRQHTLRSRRNRLLRIRVEAIWALRWNRDGSLTFRTR